MNCFKKRAMFITAGFLGIGGYILYQNLKSRVDDLFYLKLVHIVIEFTLWNMKHMMVLLII